VDHEWAAEKLGECVADINTLRWEREASGWDNARATAAGLLRAEPFMRDLMNAAKPGLGDYVELEDTPFSYFNDENWDLNVKPWALRAAGRASG
jgi:hypothetical protein